MSANRLPGNIVAMSLIITSLLLLSGLGLSTVLTQSLRRSRQADRAVASYYLANSGVEQQLHAVRKEGFTLAETEALGEVYGDESSWESTTGFEQRAEKYIPLLPEEEFSFLDLFNPDALDAVPGVGEVRVSWIPGDDCGSETSEVEIGFAEWEFSGGGVTWPAMDAYVIHPDRESPIDINTFSMSRAYRLRLRAFHCSAKDLTVRLFDSAGNPVEYEGDIRLGSTGLFEGTAQGISVVMPRQDVLSGIFNYALFSEDKLCKRVGLGGNCVWP